MTEDERWTHLITLDHKLLNGGVILSEWNTLIIQEADLAFASGAYLATIIMAVSGIETCLRSENMKAKGERLANLIDDTDIDTSLKTDLHTLRKYRNKWVHIDSPWEDKELLEHPEATKGELEEMAFFAVRTLRKTIYNDPWI